MCSLFFLLMIYSAGFAEGIIYVKYSAAGSNDGNSWNDAYIDLQDALGDAVSGNQIWVAAGTYMPSVEVGGTGSRYRTFQMINNVAIYGGFAGTETALDQRDVAANETTLSGDIGIPGDPNDNCEHIFFNSSAYIAGLDATAVLDGFHIVGGGGGYEGGGMLNSGSSPTVANCTFSNNEAVSGGGMFNNDSNPIVINCIFIGNSAVVGGGMYNHSSSPTVTNCAFSGNEADYGGGIYNEIVSNPIVTNCRFTDNSAVYDGGGMYSGYNSSSMVTNCTFSGNIADSNGDDTGDGGGIYNSNSYPAVTNCTFIGNSAACGGGMYGDPGTNCAFIGNSAFFGGGVYGLNIMLIVTNCTFSGNSAGDGGGVRSRGNLIITNCTFSGNSADRGGGITQLGITSELKGSLKIYNAVLWDNINPIYSNAGPVISYSDIQGYSGGINNIDLDPLFVEPNGVDGIVGTQDDNLHLRPWSPCIDAGDNTAISEPNDLDGKLRFIDGNCDGTAAVDMGAYELDWLYMGDFAGGCDVDQTDFAVMAQSWQLNNPAIDIAPYFEPDGIIDLAELMIIVEHWLNSK